MVKRKEPRSNEILVWSEIVSEEQTEERNKRLLEVSLGKADDGADLFNVRAEIATSAGEVYALVDWGDERNARRQLGDTVQGLDEEGRRFRLVIDFMSDVDFDYEILKAVKPSIYEYECLINPPQGHLGRTIEQFRIEPVSDDRCTVTLTVTAYFDSGLSVSKQDEVRHTMTVGAHNGLAKLKAYAEHGVGTSEAFENLRLMSL